MTVRRVRRLPLASLQPCLLEPPDPVEPFVWSRVFQNEAPVEIEVGFGKGLFLVRSAHARPEVNFVGIEIERAYQLYAANRLIKRALANVRLVKADARDFLRAYVAAATVQAIHVYFPDPWWKTRHRKRRVFTAEFVQQCERVMAPGGILHAATDVQNYFVTISGLIREASKLATLEVPDVSVPAHDMDYLTNFERKFRMEGRSIYRCRAQKRV